MLRKDNIKNENLMCNRIKCAVDIQREAMRFVLLQNAFYMYMCIDFFFYYLKTVDIFNIQNGRITVLSNNIWSG